MHERLKNLNICKRIGLNAFIVIIKSVLIIRHVVIKGPIECKVALARIKERASQKEKIITENMDVDNCIVIILYYY